MKAIIYTLSAAKDIDNLPADARVFIENGVISHAQTGEGDVKKLTGADGYRLRIGRYRVIFDEDVQTILAIYIGKRETHTYSRMCGTMSTVHYFTTLSVEEMVILSRAEFENMTSRPLSDDDEDAADLAIYRERKATLARGDDDLLPAAVSERMLRGASRLRAIRAWHGVASTNRPSPSASGLLKATFRISRAGESPGLLPPFAVLRKRSKCR